MIILLDNIITRTYRAYAPRIHAHAREGGRRLLDTPDYAGQLERIRAHTRRGRRRDLCEPFKYSVQKGDMRRRFQADFPSHGACVKTGNRELGIEKFFPARRAESVATAADLRRNRLISRPVLWYNIRQSRPIGV